MIDIVILCEEINTQLTLSSLLNNSENFRLHLFCRREQAYDKLKPTMDWAIKNFREVHVYQSPFKHRGEGSQKLARTILQFREKWKDKNPPGGPIERVIVHTQGARIFNAPFRGNVPTVKQMGDNLVFFSRKNQYFDHPFYGNYYKILDLPATKDEKNEQFLLLNWKLFKDFSPQHYFLNGKPSRVVDKTSETPKYLHDTDSFILSANSAQLIVNLKKRKYGWMPLYFDMQVDELIKKEAIGPKDVVNHNTMMRKSFSMCATTNDLYANYFDMPTLHYMAIPWDLWANKIDDIPLPIRYQGFNEKLLTKADKQKKYLRKVYEAGYLLGKI